MPGRLQTSYIVNTLQSFVDFLTMCDFIILFSAASVGETNNDQGQSASTTGCTAAASIISEEIIGRIKQTARKSLAAATGLTQEEARGEAAEVSNSSSGSGVKAEQSGRDALQGAAGTPAPSPASPKAGKSTAQEQLPTTANTTSSSSKSSPTAAAAPAALIAGKNKQQGQSATTTTTTSSSSSNKAMPTAAAASVAGENKQQMQFTISSSSSSDGELERIKQAAMESLTDALGMTQEEAAAICNSGRWKVSEQNPEAILASAKLSLGPAAAAAAAGARVKAMNVDTPQGGAAGESGPNSATAAAVEARGSGRSFADKDHTGWNFLHYAANAGDVEEVEELLAQGYDPDQGGGITPLMVACIGELEKSEDRQLLQDQPFAWLLTEFLPDVDIGKVEVARVLLKAGANVLHQHSGVSPVHLAAACGPLELVQELMPLPKMQLEQYASFGGYTPLLTAAFMGQELIVEWLVSVGADVREVQSDNGETALHMAANVKCRRSCEVLLGAGADVKAVSKNKTTALHEAVMMLKGHVGKEQEVRTGTGGGSRGGDGGE